MTPACETFQADYLAGETDGGHLAGCEDCQAAVGELDELRRFLQDTDTWSELPSDLEDRVMATLAEEGATGGQVVPGAVAEAGTGGPATPPSAPVVDLAEARRQRLSGAVAGRRRAFPRWLAAAAVAIALAGFAGFLAGRSGGDSNEPVLHQREFALAATDKAPGATATVRTNDEVPGVRIDLDVSGLPANEPGTYYQAWVKGPKGLVAIGTFRAGDGVVTLWSGVPLEDYNTLTVTLEPEDGDPASSGVRVLAGTIPPKES